jgi:hypothetical protein
MRITYFACQTLQVGDDIRVPGDLVPEAAAWPMLHGYIQHGQIAPVLVATLPESAQAVLAEWEADQEGTVAKPDDVAEPVPATEHIATETQARDQATGDQPATKTTTKTKVRG